MSNDTNLQIPMPPTPTIEEYRNENVKRYNDSLSCKIWSKEDLLIALHNGYELINNTGDTLSFTQYEGRTLQVINGNIVSDRQKEFDLNDFSQWKVGMGIFQDSLGIYRPPLSEKIAYYRKRWLF